jgi:hypothetical protein
MAEILYLSGFGSLDFLIREQGIGSRGGRGRKGS